MSYSLGFDGGGTKTESAVLDALGREVARSIAGPSNPLRVGFERAYAALSAAAETALSQAHLKASQVSAVCAGLAGASRPGVAEALVPLLEKSFPNSFVHVTADFEVALEAAAGSGPGVVLIAGTGSSAYGRNAVGETARAGGRGPWGGGERRALGVGGRWGAGAGRAGGCAGPRARG